MCNLVLSAGMLIEAEHRPVHMELPGPLLKHKQHSLHLAITVYTEIYQAIPAKVEVEGGSAYPSEFARLMRPASKIQFKSTKLLLISSLATGEYRIQTKNNSG
jgi:hypothetical protein